MGKLILFWLLLLIQVGFSQEFYVQVRVENVTDLVGMSMYIGYDPAIVEVPDTNSNSVGTQVGMQNLGFLPNSTLLASIKRNNDNEEVPGTLVVGYSTIPFTPTTGDGDCFLIEFNQLVTGDYGIHFILDKSSVQNENGVIESEWFVEDVDRSNDVARIILEMTDPNDIDPDVLPIKYELDQNYPNPFNPTTIIEYTMESSEHVVISIFDILGKEVTTLVNGEKPRGRHRIVFDGEHLATGTYYYYMSVGNKFIQSRKMTILK